MFRQEKRKLWEDFIAAFQYLREASMAALWLAEKKKKKNRIYILAFTGLLTLSNASFVTKPGEIGDNETTINNKTSWKTILWK